MNMALTPEFEHLLNEKIQAGEHRSTDDIINAAMQLFKEREQDREVLRRVNAGDALPMDERFETRLEMLRRKPETAASLLR